MSLNEIIERFTLVSGLDMREVSRYLPILSDCMLMFEEKAGDGLTEAQRARLGHACAVYAYYRICMMIRDGGMKSFKAGDVQWQAADAHEAARSAERMWMTEQNAIADIASFDSDFAFRSVSI